MMDSTRRALLGMAVIVQEVHADATATVRYAYGAGAYTVPVTALFERRTS